LAVVTTENLKLPAVSHCRRFNLSSSLWMTEKISWPGRTTSSPAPVYHRAACGSEVAAPDGYWQSGHTYGWM
jgi:hypothetical protein